MNVRRERKPYFEWYQSSLAHILLPHGSLDPALHHAMIVSSSDQLSCKTSIGLFPTFVRSKSGRRLENPNRLKAGLSLGFNCKTVVFYLYLEPSCLKKINTKNLVCVEVLAYLSALYLVLFDIVSNTTLFCNLSNLGQNVYMPVCED
jgi:hypothetical protein